MRTKFLIAVSCAATLLITGCSITATPKPISSVLPKTQLDYSNLNLSSVPDEIFGEIFTQQLNLSHNKLNSIPSEIGKLQQLKTLNLSYNNLTGLPAEIGQLSNLEVLDASHNRLTGLPLELGNLDHLKILNLLGNPYSKKDLQLIAHDLPNTLIVTSSTSTATSNLSTTKKTSMDSPKHYTAILHTEKGDIEIALNFGETPNTVKNFVDLSNKNFYNNTIFHRVIKGFMIQGGDPKGDGTGGPGYKFNDETFTGDYTRGTVAMANSGPNTNGSQFFIMQADYPLPKNYVIFGHVSKGMEVVDSIANEKVTVNDFGEPSKPVVPTVVKSVEIKTK